MLCCQLIGQFNIYKKKRDKPKRDAKENLHSQSKQQQQEQQPHKAADSLSQSQSLRRSLSAVQGTAWYWVLCTHDSGHFIPLATLHADGQTNDVVINAICGPFGVELNPWSTQVAGEMRGNASL